MKDLIALIENKNPGATSHPYFKYQAWKWTRQYGELQRLRYRRPELYESALMALVNYIADHCTDEEDAKVLAAQRRVREAQSE